MCSRATIIFPFDQEFSFPFVSLSTSIYLTLYTKGPSASWMRGLGPVCSIEFISYVRFQLSGVKHIRVRFVLISSEMSSLAVTSVILFRMVNGPQILAVVCIYRINLRAKCSLLILVLDLFSDNMIHFFVSLSGSRVVTRSSFVHREHLWALYCDKGLWCKFYITCQCF